MGMIEDKKFNLALQKLKDAGSELNSAYYMTNYPEKHRGTGLWELIKKAEKIADDILWKMILLDNDMPNAEEVNDSIKNEIK